MRFIQLTEEMKKQALEQFTNMLNNQRSSDSSIKFSFDLKNKAENTEIIVNFTTTAWLKMWALVSSEKGEIGWHGIVEKVSKGAYLIKDILMYPQYVTGTTVQTDDVGYGNWLHKEISDEQINTLRFHGHSHVHMSTSPSGVDTTWYNEILQGLGNDDFYIFGIFNKREEYFMEIYDLAENTIYEKSDITLNVVLNDGMCLEDWVTDTKTTYLKEKTATPAVNNTKTFIDKHYKSNTEYNLESVLIKTSLDEIKKNADLRKIILKEVNKQAYYEAYFNVAYGRWFSLKDMEKITAAKKYYEAAQQLDILEELEYASPNQRVQEILAAQKKYSDKFGGNFYYD